MKRRPRTWPRMPDAQASARKTPGARLRSGAMKLGEALTIRADLQKRIAQLGSRLQASGVVQEGDTPPEDPAALLAELETLTDELERLIARINLTNAQS